MPPGEKRIRTLVVDDSVDFLRDLCGFLDTLSNVDVVAKGRSGRDAVTLAHEWMPDLVLMDVRMPETTGLEAASQLARELPEVIVILTSAFEVEGSGVRRRLSLSVWQHHNRKSISNSLRGIRVGAQS